MLDALPERRLLWPHCSHRLADIVHPLYRRANGQVLGAGKDVIGISCADAVAANVDDRTALLCGKMQPVLAGQELSPLIEKLACARMDPGHPDRIKRDALLGRMHLAGSFLAPGADWYGIAGKAHAPAFANRRILKRRQSPAERLERCIEVIAAQERARWRVGAVMMRRDPLPKTHRRQSREWSASRLAVSVCSHVPQRRSGSSTQLECASETLNRMNGNAEDVMRRRYIAASAILH